MREEVVDGDQVEDEVDHHQHQDGDVEEKYSLVSNILNKARWYSNIRLHIRTIRKKNIQAKDKNSERSCKTPGKDGEEDEPWDFRTALYIADGAAEIQAEDRHPSKHRNTDKVTKVSNDDAKERSGWRNIIDNNDVGGDKENTADIDENYFSMKFEQIRNRDIHNEGDGEGEEADNAKDGEDHVVLPVVPLTHLLLLALEHHDVPGTVYNPDLHAVSQGVSISLMVQLPILHDRVALPRLQQVEGAAVGHQPCLVDGEEVRRGGYAQGEGEIHQQLRETGALGLDKI